MKSLLLLQHVKVISIKNEKLNENKGFIQLKWGNPCLETIFTSSSQQANFLKAKIV